MKWNIVTDSSCDLFPQAGFAPGAELSSVPFVVSVGEHDYVDDPSLDTAAFLDAMEGSEAPSRTSCPSPQAWLEQFEKAEQSIALTISSNLSGSYNSAMTAKQMAQERAPEKKIAVLDSLSTGPEVTLCVEKIRALIEAGEEFSGVVEKAQAQLRETRIAFALCSFHNLVKNGRMSRLAENLELAQKLQSKILELWQSAKVSIMPTRGLCSYYAERNGLIVGYSQA